MKQRDMVPSKQFDTHLLSRYFSCSFFNRIRAMSLRIRREVRCNIYTITIRY